MSTPAVRIKSLLISSLLLGLCSPVEVSAQCLLANPSFELGASAPNGALETKVASTDIDNSTSGNIDINEISKLAKKLDIKGVEHLDELDKEENYDNDYNNQKN